MVARAQNTSDRSIAMKVTSAYNVEEIRAQFPILKELIANTSMPGTPTK